MSGRARRALADAVRATRPRWRQLALSVLLGTGAVLAAVGLLTTSGYLISRAAQRPEILALSVAIVGVRFFGIARALLRYLERLVSHDLAFRTLGDLRRRFLARLLPLVPGGLPGRRSELLGRFVDDVDRLQDLYLRALAPPLVALFAGLGAVLVALLILPAAAAVLAAMLAAGGLLAPWLTRLSARRAGRRQAAARSTLGTDVLEIASGSAEIAMAGREREWLDRVEEDGAALGSLQRRDAVSAGLAAGLGTALAAAAAVCVAAVAIPAVHDGEIAGVLLGALVLLAIASFEAVAPLGAAAASIDACADSALRVGEVVDREPAIVDPPDPTPVPAGCDLVATDLRFRREGQSGWLLDGLGLRLEQGSSLALLGASGSGKTTLVELLVRLLAPSGGRLRLGGVDLASVSERDLRATVRLAPQDAYLFATTIRDNVAVGRGDADDEEIAGALETVGLGGWLASLAEGLDTFVGEGGRQVSGGQRQRIAAARLLLSGARFLILDEPTAHLDRAAAALMERRFTDLARSGPGLLWVTHEPAELSCFDRVVRLEGGRLLGC
ncbi:MAG: thiol reductant ABC exporter subunit CydC [Solirubrobacterales bacterium]